MEQIYQNNKEAVLTIDVNPQKRQIISGSMDDTFSAVDLNTDELIAKLQFNETVSSVKYNFDYSRSIASCLNNKIYIIDNSNFQIVKEITEIDDEITHLETHK